MRLLAKPRLIKYLFSFIVITLTIVFTFIPFLQPMGLYAYWLIVFIGYLLLLSIAILAITIRRINQQQTLLRKELRILREMLLNEDKFDDISSTKYLEYASIFGRIKYIENLLSIEAQSDIAESSLEEN